MTTPSASHGPDDSKMTRQDTSTSQDAARIALGLMLMFAGTSHLTFGRKPFRAQVPRWVPFDRDTVVLGSGVFEIALGTALAFIPGQKRVLGRVAGAFFTCIFPGNIAQYKHRRKAFGLDTDEKRFARLFFQPVFIAWALWSTDARRSAHNTQTEEIKEPPRDDPDKDDPPSDEPGKNDPPNNEPPVKEPPATDED
jgi:uncharacterized membrane protein